MTRKKLIRRELKLLKQSSDTFAYKVEQALTAIRGDQARLYLNRPDKIRLMILRSWTIKYHCNLKYILQTLIPFWTRFVSQRSRKQLSKGLNVRVSTLTGNKSESVLKEHLEQDFPSDLLYRLWKSNEQEKIYSLAEAKLISPRLKDDDGIPVKYQRKKQKKQKNRRLEDSRTIDRFVKRYTSKIKKAYDFREKLVEEFQERPYRLNPFIGE